MYSMASGMRRSESSVGVVERLSLLLQNLFMKRFGVCNGDNAGRLEKEQRFYLQYDGHLIAVLRLFPTRRHYLPMKWS